MGVWRVPGFPPGACRPGFPSVPPTVCVLPGPTNPRRLSFFLPNMGMISTFPSDDSASESRPSKKKGGGASEGLACVLPMKSHVSPHSRSCEHLPAGLRSPLWMGLLAFSLFSTGLRPRKTREFPPQLNHLSSV